MAERKTPTVTAPRAHPANSSNVTDAKASGGGSVSRIRLFGSPKPWNFDAALLVGVTLLLVVVGLVMVLSSSSVEEYAAHGGVSSKFLKQLILAVLGIPIMFIASAIPMRWWWRLAYPMLIIAVALQALVFTPLGFEIQGNRSWLELGPINLQPAELAKVALMLWLGSMVRQKGSKMNDWRQILLPIGGPVLISIGLALAGADLGTVIVMGALVLGGLWFGGLPTRYIVTIAVVAIAAAILFAAISPNRVARISTFFSAQCDIEVECWQTRNGFYALARGGLLGVGLGNSTAKWSWLPEADNDFIFAIIGEEFGLIGSFAVILLFVTLLVAMYRILRNAPTAGARTVVGAAATWLAFQAFVNIAVVLGLLPVLGVPLPLLSSGGSALITTLLAIGIVLAIARSETGVAPMKMGTTQTRPGQTQRSAPGMRLASERTTAGRSQPARPHTGRTSGTRTTSQRPSKGRS